ncbi:hypothetical protein ACLOJK_006657 [Asimina triloba]
MDLLMDREDEVDDGDGFDDWPWLDRAKLSVMDLLAGADGGAGLDESIVDGRMVRGHRICDGDLLKEGRRWLVGS